MPALAARGYRHGPNPIISKRGDIHLKNPFQKLATAALCVAAFAAAGCQKGVTTPSGLHYEDIQAGKGEEAKAGDMVQVHYTGTLQKDGSKFDSSVDRGQPFAFTLGQGQVIPGWDEGVAGMKEGGKRKLTIPAQLGYGERGSGDKIPPNSTLLFDVELLKVLRAPAQKDEFKSEDITAGTGAEAKSGDTVEVHYTGTLTDGSKFDSSVDRGQPFTFPLGQGQVIPGWDQGVAGMKEGGKRKLTIPYDLAYGAQGRPGKIPPYATLLFDIELLKVHAPPKLEIKDLKNGKGAEAKAGDTVDVHYTGWLTDGKKFDSSKDRGKPFTFTLGQRQVIQGWDQGVAGMKEGGKRKLTIPHELAYGPRGQPPTIPPAATLVFEIELLKVH